jgi:K(+)-stimulated pyrophosphate-energized sodium pump
MFGLYVALAAAVLSLLLAILFLLKNKRIPIRDSRIAEISGFIRSGAMAFLRREYCVVAMFIVVLAVIFFFLPTMGWRVSASFICGAVMSLLAGFVGMRSATISNARTAQAAQESEIAALRTAFTGGSVMGLSVVGLGLFGVTVCYLVFQNTNILTGFSLGASLVALFSRVGGGIYTKAADVGADLVGKVEQGIPEDDPRNPAVIADNVGDNVGDVAGMGADLFESYVGAIVSSVILGIVAGGQEVVSFLFLLCGCGAVAAILGILYVRLSRRTDPQRTMMGGTYISMLLFIVAALILDHLLLGSYMHFVAVLTGIVSGIVTGLSTEWYTSSDFRAVKSIADKSRTGPATNILEGLSAGMRSTAVPIVIIVLAVVVSFIVLGILGVALSAVGMLATVAAIIAVDAYGPIADNAGGIAQMTGLPANVREITDKLDAVGNTTAAIGKGFSIGSAALTALALLSSYTSSVGLETVNVLDSRVIGGFFLGGGLAYLFCSLAIDAVSHSAVRIIDEVRRQFREITGIWDGTAKPDYNRCVDIATGAALKNMLLPGSIAVISPVVVGIVLGRAALAGMLMGSTLCGVLLALFMSNSGGAWDNAKKLIEEDGKGSEAHKAAVIGDTVGDPLKDTAGPSLNILIKLMSIVALLFAPMF